LTATVAQTAALLGVISGRPIELRGVHGLRVGVLRAQVDDLDVTPGVLERVMEALNALSHAGFELVDVDVPELALVDSSLGGILLKEAWDVHRERFEREGDGYGPGTRALLELASRATEDDYRQALADRDRVVAGFARVLEDVAVLAGPTVAYVAPPEDPPVGTPEGELEGRFTGPYNVAGLPAVSVPCGPAEGPLPAGLQLAAARGEDALLLSVARAYEEVSP
jgi:aspartyl-tRNA(Asn)/glutamyl-tRNA(Gln) amidotransferase subunit A